MDCSDLVSLTRFMLYSHPILVFSYKHKGQTPQQKFPTGFLVAAYDNLEI